MSTDAHAWIATGDPMLDDSQFKICSADENIPENYLLMNIVILDWMQTEFSCPGDESDNAYVMSNKKHCYQLEP